MTRANVPVLVSELYVFNNGRYYFQLFHTHPIHYPYSIHTIYTVSIHAERFYCAFEWDVTGSNTDIALH